MWNVTREIKNEHNKMLMEITVRYDKYNEYTVYVIFTIVFLTIF